MRPLSKRGFVYAIDGAARNCDRFKHTTLNSAFIFGNALFKDIESIGVCPMVNDILMVIGEA